MKRQRLNSGISDVCRKSRKTSPPYRVKLHNDNFNRREYVVQVLMKVIPRMTLDNVVNIMQEAQPPGDIEATHQEILPIGLFRQRERASFEFRGSEQKVMAIQVLLLEQQPELCDDKRLESFC